MNDTPPEVEVRYRAMLMQQTGAERLIMGCAMRDTARAFVEASLWEQHPGHGGRHPQEPLSPLLRTRIRCPDTR